jgi:hypothetical protein
VDELEPQAAITVTAASAAAAAGSVEAVLNMTHVVAGSPSHECNTLQRQERGKRCGPCVTAL